MAIRPREVRERERRKRAKKNRTQLVWATQGGQRRPMQQGYTTTSVQPPKFREPNVGGDITQAGLAFKGGKGLHEFATGKEAYINEAGKSIPARAPWSLGGKSISDRLSQYGTDVSDRFTNTPRDLGNLFNPQPSPSELAQLERANIGFGSNQGLLGPKPPPFKVPGYGGGMIDPGGGAGEGMTFLQGPRISGMPTSAATGMSSLNAPMNAAASFGQGLGSEAALSNLFSGAGAGGMQGLGHLGSFGGGAEGIQGLGHLSGTGAGGFGGGSAPFGTLNQAGTGIEAGTSTADAASGLQGGGGQPWLAYANIGKDLFMGGPQSEKITGSTAGDAALRAAAAYYTFGLSEIPYAFF